MIHRIRRMLASLAVCGAIAGVPTAALAWAAGTHAYIAKHTNKMGGRVTDAEMCRRVLGANGPDLFNTSWSDEGQVLAAVLHTRDPAPNLAPWNVADGAMQRAYGFGFASHNDAWGTDSTAHYAGRTFGRDVGYVPAKAALVGDLLAGPIGDALGLPPEYAQGIAREVSHNFVEFAVDFLLAQADPDLAWTLYGSAGCYVGDADDAFLFAALEPYLLPALSSVKPGAGPADVWDWIVKVESPFVDGLGANGLLLSLPYPTAKQLLAAQTAIEAQGYLAYKGFVPPPPVEVLQPLIEAGIDLAMVYCAPDFMDEIEATIGWVNGRMSSNGISP